MKKLLLLVLLAGCDTDGYRVYVDQRSVCAQRTFFVCERVNDGTSNFSVAYCDTKKECNIICDKLRRRASGIKEN